MLWCSGCRVEKSHLNLNVIQYMGFGTAFCLSESCIWKRREVQVMVVGWNTYFFTEMPEGWLNDSCKFPSSCRGRKSRNPCGGGSGLQMPMWLWQSAYFLYQETDTWIGEISKLRRHLSDFHDMREVQISLQMVGPNIRNASRTCLHHVRKQNNWRGFCLNNLRIESIPLDFDSLHHPVELGCKAANSML